MDYQCECGEEFDIYEYDRSRRDWEMDDEDDVMAHFTAQCPKCGKIISCVEHYTYSKTVIVE